MLGQFKKSVVVPAVFAAVFPLSFTSAAHADGMQRVDLSPPQVKTSDLRTETALFIAEAPIRASKDRVAVIVRGGSPALLRSVHRAAKAYSSENGGAQTYMLYTRDMDGDPDTVEVDFYGDHVHYVSLSIENPGEDFVEIEERVKRLMHKTYNDRVVKKTAKQNSQDN